MTKLGLLLFLLIAASASAVPFEDVTEEIRQYYLERAQVWRKMDIPRLNIRSGPQNEVSVPPETEVTCRYMEWEKEPGGVSPKFDCRLKNGEKVRVKYGENPEVFAEATATRLLWALGFYSDDVYPVRIRCEMCPEVNPFKPSPGEKRVEKQFRFAVIERQFPVTIEAKDDQGWSWKELEKVKADQGGATPDEIGALALLAVFIQHGDQKPSQQRLGCRKADLTDLDKNGKFECRRPILMVQDLGSTFGRADQFTTKDAKMQLQLWEEKDIWDLTAEAEYLKRTNQRACIGNLTVSAAAAGQGLENPHIREGARKFLSDLLMQLSDAQIQDLFELARAGQRPVAEDDDPDNDDALRHWVDAFKKKRQQIAERECPE